MRLVRAELALLFALPVLWAPLECAAQRARPPYRIGILHESFVPSIPQVEGLKAGLKAIGLEEGRDVIFDIRFTSGVPEARPAAAAALVKARVDLIFTAFEEAAHAAKDATQTIPIVFVTVGDPVAAGLVVAIAQPGGNLTGISSLDTELVPKRLEILKAVFPALRRVWAVYHAGDRSSSAAGRKVQEVATRLNLEPVVHPVRTTEELVGYLRTVRAGDGLLCPSALSMDIPGLILDLALAGRVPAVFGNSFWVQAGAVVSYGSDLHADGVQAARLVARILRGARARDLPVEGSNSIHLALNLKTAKSLGITIPAELVVRANQVIE